MSSASPLPAPLHRRRLLAAGLMGVGAALTPAAAWALNRGELVAQARQALTRLAAQDPAARMLRARARAVLVFPEITKAGFIVGGANGNGVLFQGGVVAGFYQFTAGSIGLQAGAQKFGYALFFMTQSALDYLRSSDGWSIGAGPQVTAVDQGVAKTLNTTTARSDVYAEAFDQRGLMASVAVQGAKISPIK